VGTETVASGTGTPEGTPGATGTTTPVVPVTGGKSPAFLTVMMDMCVFDRDGEQIGQVNDLIINLDSLQIAFVVVDSGGLLSIGEKNVAVPYNQLEMSTSEAGAGCEFAFTLKADKQAFENAKEVDLDELPPIGVPADPNWEGKFLEFWNNEGGSTTGTPAATGTAEATGTPAGTPEGTPGTGAKGEKLHGVVLASTLLGMSFSVPNQPDLVVTIKDIAVEVQSGKLLHAIISANIGGNERLIAIPIELLSLDVDGMTLVLDVDAATLEQAPNFTEGQFPDVTHETWDDAIVEFWQSLGLNP
jgi:hypothetical protein